jgi:hypothetical protein
LIELLKAGDVGCTPFTHVGPRWLGYVFKLRTIYGLNIETITESHGGNFSGYHARYVLRTKITFADPIEASILNGGGWP